MRDPRPEPPLPPPWAELLRGEEAFLALSRHLRCLAVSLVSDEAAADDLVQETWLAALDGELPAVRSPRAWLLAVLRRQAGGFHRGRLRRGDIEALWAPGEEVESEAERAARESTWRLLHRCVGELREPYRGVLVERFFEERSVTEIARRRNVSRETVKSQVRRGMEELRLVLDRQHGGDREAWAALLVPWVVRRELAPAPPPTGGLPVRALAGAAVAVGALVVAVSWTSGERGNDPPRLVVGAAPPSVEAPVEPATRREVPAARTETKGPPPAATPTPARNLEVRVTDEDGRPAAGAELLVWGDGRELFGSFRADALGHVALEIPVARLAGEPAVPGPHGGVALAARPEGGAWSWLYHLPLAPEGSTFEILAPGRGQTLAGRVRDERGEPVSGAEVTLRRSLRGPNRTPEGVPFGERTLRTWTDDEGRFELVGVRHGVHVVTAAAEGFRAGRAVLEGDAARLEAEVLLEAGATLRGRVLAAGGGPAAGVRVWDATFRPPGSGEGAAEARTDAEGRFVLAGLEGGPRLFFAQDPDEPARFATTVLDAEGEAGAEWEAVLEVTPGLRLRVTEADGTPVARAALAVMGEREDVDFGLAARADARGEARLHALPAGGVAVGVQRSSADTRPLVLRRGLEPSTEWTVLALPARAEEFIRLTGRVRDVHGGELGPVRIIGCGDMRSFQVEADPRSGRFEASAPAGRYRLWAVVEGSGYLDLGRQELGPGGTHDLGLHLAPPRSRIELVRGEKTAGELLLHVVHDCAELGPPLVARVPAGVGHLELRPGRYALTVAGADWREVFEVSAPAAPTLELP